MKTLAEHLGAIDPERPDDDPTPVEPSADIRISVQAFCEGILSSQEYRNSVMNRIYLGELPAAVEVLLYHYAFGKPVEHVEIKDKTRRLSNLSATQLEEKALRLAEKARVLRMLAANNAAATDEDGAVH